MSDFLRERLVWGVLGAEREWSQTPDGLAGRAFEDSCKNWRCSPGSWVTGELQAEGHISLSKAQESEPGCGDDREELIAKSW